MIPKISALNLADVVLEVLNKCNMDVFNCRRQSYNNASNMSGTYNGMQAEIKKDCKYTNYCSCAARSLNLVGELASSCCIESAISFYYQ